MGITGLLPYLEKATRPCHISEFRGGTVAVDSYCLLHRGANACAEQLARGEDSRLYVDYCIKFIRMLLNYNIHPILVFDGKNLPAKAQTEAKRRESRKKSKQRAAELLKLGKTEEARTYLKQCIDITPKMAHNLIKECHAMNVDCIVAPYEADAQMAFFNLKGVAECVITEDSDLILFGCSKALYKLDLSGQGRLVEADKINHAMNMRPDQYTFEKFRYMCILSGCDYVSSLTGIGLKKAEKFLKLTIEANPEVFLDKIPRYLNMKHLEITQEYKREFLVANATFLHQVVYDPYKRKLVNLTDPELKGTNPDYLVNAGDIKDHDKATQVALGNINPYNFEQYDNWRPDKVPKHSIWSGIYQKRISVTQQKQLQKEVLENFIKRGNNVSLKSCKTEEEDAMVEQDLSIYLKKSKTEENRGIKRSANEDKIEIKSRSPLSLKNPFLKTKLSKFPKTESCSNLVVKSRFFEGSVLTLLEPIKKEPDCDQESSLAEKCSEPVDAKKFINICLSPGTDTYVTMKENSEPGLQPKKDEIVVVPAYEKQFINICLSPGTDSHFTMKEDSKPVLQPIKEEIVVVPAYEKKFINICLSPGTDTDVTMKGDSEPVLQRIKEEIVEEPADEKKFINICLSPGTDTDVTMKGDSKPVLQRIKEEIVEEPADEKKFINICLSPGTDSDVTMKEDSEPVLQPIKEEIVVEPDLENIMRMSDESNSNSPTLEVEVLGYKHDDIISIDCDENVAGNTLKKSGALQQDAKKRKLNNKKSKQTSLHNFFYTFKKE